jgi:glycolate oxidase FAD binding subunit
LSLDLFKDRIVEASTRKTPLRLRGGGTKDFYGNEPRGEVLDTRGYNGVVDYEPTELVITAKCGTPLVEMQNLLDKQNQMLPFEPPHFGEGATLGGCVAAGLSGPRRAAAGALRDYVLGAKIVDGRGRELAFGGQVMKNVAGYDVSRLLAGSLGTLGLIAEVSLKVLPRPAASRTLRQQMTQSAALDAMNRWAGQPLPITASAWHDGTLWLRLEGRAAALEPAAREIGGGRLEEVEAAALWKSIREHSHAFFAAPAPLWRLAVPPSSPPLEVDARPLIEWGGGLRWLKSDAEPALVREVARRAGGHATLFRAAKKAADAFTEPAPVAMRVHRSLKAAFDPAGILNPGRLYPDL